MSAEDRSIELNFDVIVVGSGHAGSCAALSARDAGAARVLVVDKCPESWAGGNGYFTAGAHRTVHGGLADLLPLVRNAPPDAARTVDMAPYSAAEFAADIDRLGAGRADPALVRAVVDGSRAAVGWLAERAGVPFVFSFNRQAYLVDGKQVFWGGMVLGVEDGGKGLIAAHHKALKEAGVEMWFDTAAEEVILEEGAVVGLVVCKDGQRMTLRAPAVVLACGGFESSRELRSKHLGERWARAMVRGTPYNTGDGLTLGQRAGARLTGDFASCHSTCWDANASPDVGDRLLSNQFTKSGYPLGLMLNADGARFVDEGADFRNYTYAAFGRAILAQPGGFAFQVWDSPACEWLRAEEYADGVVEKVWAESVPALAEALTTRGLADAGAFVRTIEAYNAATRAFAVGNPDKKWDPAVKDGLSTRCAAGALELPKSNWARPLAEGPFLAVKVGCGITFTFGGLAIDPDTAGVVNDATGDTIPGLFCTGELVGGLFYNNYPGGSGLTAGAVFGRKAGGSASRRSRTAL
ncbi:FAD/NAD-P-binding domain-containing protein [Epithele typhae]|uniref:FAD/NAD-P-binding domain-containing protein n=1 Tax=Epithele typhae TaxID=378194 RepID=UPI002007609B|nr:FAD/NAD-P-binding domain-containing protein [Epithele typhae]KAH9925390.1 FAD/NAD-P-binding domain-containing protein [Epithele typhae]